MASAASLLNALGLTNILGLATVDEAIASAAVDVVDIAFAGDDVAEALWDAAAEEVAAE